MERAVQFLSSLRLTFVCLGLAFVLVFAGTMAQVHLGLYAVQSQYFRSFFVYWTPPGSHWRIPVLPGGWLIGCVLIVNLLAAHITRFRFARNKLGILIIHFGLVLLLLGQFCTEIMQVESQMRLEVGASKNYSEDSKRNELVVVDVTDPDRDRVVSVPDSILEKGGKILLPGLPFSLRVERYLANCLPAGPMTGEGEKISAVNGIGRRLLFAPAPRTTRMDDENKPAALVEVLTDKGTLGDWVVSTWLTKHPWVSVLQQEVGGVLDVALDAPQSFSCAGRTYELALRPVRYYQPYTITLLEFRHDTYAGTDIPSNFSSKIHLSDPSRGENRDVIIRMNAPLRYRGESYYQASFENGDRVSILQVVRNPAALTPYVACALIGAGLLVQFLTHLFKFAKKRATAQTTARPRRAGQTIGGVSFPHSARSQV